MKTLLIALLMLLPMRALAQYSVWSEPIINNLGQPIVGAGVAVCSGSAQPTLVVPCGGSSLVTIYSSFTGGAQFNPFFTDSNGLAPVYTTSGNYWIQVYGTGLQTTVIPISIGGGGSSGTVNVGTINCSAYYAATGTTISPQCNLLWTGLNAGFVGNISAGNDGVHQGAVLMIGNTIPPTTLPTTGYFGFTGFPSTSAGTYVFTPNATPPTVGQVFTAGTPATCTGSSATCIPLNYAAAGISGSGTTNTFPVFTASSVIGNSNLTVVTSPNGINYSLSGGQSIQWDSSHLSFNSGISGSNNVVIANTYNPGNNNNAGGVIVQGAPTSGSACAGEVQVLGGTVNGGGNAGITVQGNCANGFGQIGGGVIIGVGGGTGGNGDGNITLETGTNGAVIINGGILFQGGTTFTASGCSNGTRVGGPTAGKFTVGASGACTITITMGGQTASHGWACWASDQTTAAGNPIYQSGGSTTTAILSLPAGAASSDVITFGCLGY